MAKTFLTAEWRKLAMANYAVQPGILTKYLPYRTELDIWEGNCYVSLVGFKFVNTKVMGLRIPFHHTFEEVNLRFYVRYKAGNGEWRRGVVFIKEIVPKAALTFVANTIYKEHYETMDMAHTWEASDDTLTVEYKWKRREWNAFKVITASSPVSIADGSEEEFITEHYWGYTKIGEHKTTEYGVEHPRWQVYPLKSYGIQVNFGSVYGHEFEFLNTEVPRSVFLAEGSQIAVKEGLAV